MTESSAPQPATLRRRTAAFALDYFVIAGYLLVLVGVGTLLRAAAPSVADALFALLGAEEDLTGLGR